MIAPYTNTVPSRCLYQLERRNHSRCSLSQTSRGRCSRVVTLNEVKGLSERFFAEFILSVVEGLRMTWSGGPIIKCTNVTQSGLVFLSLLLFVTLLHLDSYNGSASAEESHTHYRIVNGAIPEPLTHTAGDSLRGRQIVEDRERGDCIVCHVIPLSNHQMHGTVGPPLDGVGGRYPAGVLRLRLADSKMINPQSVMPAYYKTTGLFRVSKSRRDQTLLPAQEIEDVIAYLLTLTYSSLASGGQNTQHVAIAQPDGGPHKGDQSPYSVDARRSGYTYLSPDNQQLQNDEFANPGMLWVERGRELWGTTDGTVHAACTNCHADGESMRGVRTRYPRFDPQRNKLINLEQQINRCREQQMKATAYAYESEALLALTTFISFQSRNQPMNVQIDGPVLPFFRAGRAFFRQRRGQLDLACTHCHDLHNGQRLRGEVISQGHTNGFPIYRQLWQTLGSSHRMFAWCNTAIRAEPFALGSDEYVNLELYMAWRARGLPIESPAIRR